MTFAAAALILLSGCGTSRRAVRSDTAATSETSSAIHTATAGTSSEHSVTHTGLSNDTETVTEVTEFDTTLPADPATGTPPVKRRIVKTSRAATQIKQATTAESQTQTATEALASEDTRSAVRTEEQTRRGLNTLQSILCAVGFATLAGLALRLFVKLRGH